MSTIRLKTNQIKDEIIDESNRTSSINRDNEADLNMSNLTLNLGTSLKSDIINNLVMFSSLLRGQAVKNDVRKKLFDSNAELMQRLLTLMTGNELVDNLDLIDENSSKDSNNGGLFFELNFSTRRDIVDLLNRNFSSVFLSKCSVNERDNLIKENNNMICILINLVARPLQTVDTDDNESIFNRPTKKVKSSDQIVKLAKKVEILETKVKELGADSSEVEFHFCFENVRDFLKTKKTVLSEYFYCSSIKWFIGLQSSNEKDGIKYLGLFVWPDYENFSGDNLCKWSIKADFEFILSFNAAPNVSKQVKKHLFKEKVGIGFNYFVKHDDLIDSIEDDSIKVGIKFKADFVCEFKNQK